MAKAGEVQCSDENAVVSDLKTNTETKDNANHKDEEPQGKDCASDIQVWEYNPSDEDQRLPHQYTPNKPLPLQHLHGLGVLTWKIDVCNWESNPMLEKIKKDRGYKYWETKIVSPEAMEDYEDKIKMFFQEHMHSQEEIRLILDGEGYWDVRNYDDKWIRFRVKKGDLIVLPPGMFHRFTLDVSNYIEALLLYTDEPCRTQHGRSQSEEESKARKLYVDNFLKSRVSLMDLNKDYEVPAAIEVPAQ